MVPILITTDPVLLGFAQTSLADAGIEAVMADQYTSAIEGSIGVLPQRLLVAPATWHQARQVLADLGLEADLVAEDAAAAAQTAGFSPNSQTTIAKP